MLKGKWNKRRILLVAELIVLLALLPGCFHKEELVENVYGEDVSGIADEQGHLAFYGEKQTLSPGVYQIRVRTSLAEGQGIYVQMKSEQASFKSLRNNGMNIFPGNDYADFEVYVLDNVPGAYVQCDFYGADADVLVQLELWKTNMGNRMLFFIAVVFFAVLDFLVEFRSRILEGRISGKQQVVFWTLSAGVFLAYFPFLTDYFIGGYDSNFHWSRIAFLADSLRQGVSIPIRLEGTWMYGHGYASPLFYGDLFIYIPAFLRLLGFSVMTSYKMLVFLATAGTALIVYYSLKRCVKDEYAALFGSMVYLLAPYRLYNVYGRGAVGEFLAQIFLPLVCCGMYLLYTEDVTSGNYKKYKWYVIIGLSAILQSHLISTEMIAVSLVLLCALFWKKTFRRQTFCQLLMAVGIVLVLNVWFWLPLLYMMYSDAYQMQEIYESVQLGGIPASGLFHYLPSTEDVQNGKSVSIGAGMVLLFLCYAVWRNGKGGKNRKRICDVLAVFSVLAIAVSTRYFPWDAIIKLPGIRQISVSMQLPFRWLSIVGVLSAFFSAFFFRQVMEKGGLAAKTVLGIAAILITFSAVYQVGVIAYEAKPIYLYNEENMGTISVVGGEYLLADTEVADFYYHKPLVEDGLIWLEYEKEGNDINILLVNATEDTRYIEMPLIGYKGYVVKVLDDSDDEKIPYISEQRGAHGDLRIAVPAGYRGRIEIAYEGFALFHVAEAVSLAGIVVIAGMFLWQQFSLRKRGMFT